MQCCEKKTENYTLLFRIERADDMLRGCTEEAEFRNGEYSQQNESVTIYYESCGLDLCNHAGTIWMQGTLVTLLRRT